MAGVPGLLRASCASPFGSCYRMIKIVPDDFIEPVSVQILPPWSYLTFLLYLSHNWGLLNMAGVPGFEPGYARIKTLCLTAWRHPNYF